MIRRVGSHTYNTEKARRITSRNRRDRSGTMRAETLYRTRAELFFVHRVSYFKGQEEPIEEIVPLTKEEAAKFVQEVEPGKLQLVAADHIGPEERIWVNSKIPISDKERIDRLREKTGKSLSDLIHEWLDADERVESA